MLTQAGQWQETVSALPMTDGKGHNYYYYIASVTEEGMPEGTVCSVKLDNGEKYIVGPDTHSGEALEITNTLDETVDFVFSKIWRDPSGSGGIIANDAMGVELPSTGSHLTAGLVLALGAALLLASGAALTIRTRGRRKAEE